MAIETFLGGALSWSTVPNQSVPPTYPYDITGLKAAHLAGNGTAFLEDVGGDNLVASGHATYTDSTDTLRVIQNPLGRRVRFGANTNTASAEADWLIRSGQDPSSPQPGVVWFHDFRNKSEVDYFRWGGVTNGNDPLDLSVHAGKVRQDLTDGITGGACMAVEHTAGLGSNSWWRPFSPLSGATNGKGVDDPAANGTLPIGVWSTAQNSGYCGTGGNTWRLGWYGHTSYHAADPTLFDGNEFWYQVRVKMDPNRTAPGNTTGGKFQYFTTTRASAQEQELVVIAVKPGLSSGLYAGMPNILTMYQSDPPGPQPSLPLEQLDVKNVTLGWQAGSSLYEYPAQCAPDANLGNCWVYSFGWDTLMFHLKPGRDGVTETEFQLYGAHPGETQWTTIYDVIIPTYYEPTSTWEGLRNGLNAVIYTPYTGGSVDDCAVGFTYRYEQIIFSKQPIPLPDDPVQRGEV